MRSPGLFNDALPPSRWRARQTIVEKHRLRRSKPWAEPPTRLRLTPFARRDGTTWIPLAVQEVPLKTP